ncbi:hypothetical protein RHSIM_Rhsim08G0172400 [Rhododendron simsii]|uniref:Uncharacterized protein n=1 Tax=Rhododendron simsii TaxID=118357 RepID=A0A834GHP2_RHOSS|nr:hypothetical protein RHSIM_Rhsim08G0172400 [Rhododendron simsii]
MAEQGNGQGLDDFNTPSNPSFEVDSPRYKSTMVHDSIGLESREDHLSQIDSGSTLVPNTYNEISLDNICGTILHQSKKDAIAVIDELNKRIELLEKEKKIRVEKVLQKSKKKSPPLKFKRVKERDDRKTNFCENYVYGKLKRKSPQVEFVDVDDFQETSLAIQVQKPKKKLKNLEKCNAEMSKLIHTETWLAIEQLWKIGNPSAVIWSFEANMLRIEVEDIQNLLYYQHQRLIP